MRNVSLEGLTIGFLSAHPDDHIIHASVAAQALEKGAIVHERVATKGEGGINLRRGENPPFSVKDGDRQEEAKKSAALLGIETYTQLSYPDGDLRSYVQWLAEGTAQWARENGINVLVTPATGDHDDHDAVVRAGRIAAELLEAVGYPLDLLEALGRQPAAEGETVVEFASTPESQALAFGAVVLNRSQFEAEPDTRQGWNLMPGGVSVSPDTLQRLDVYALMETARYRLVPATAAGQLLVAQTAALAMA